MTDRRRVELAELRHQRMVDLSNRQEAGVNGAALKARADALATNLKAREDGPDQDYASFPVFKDYAMASFTVLISSAVVEGFFSQFEVFSTLKTVVYATNSQATLQRLLREPRLRRGRP